jgi:hypothetical protein
VIRGTRAPEGASPGRRPADATYREVALWPGITWGRDARCSCSWTVRYGVMQVKVRSGACTVHLTAEEPAPPPPMTDDEALLLACELGGAEGWAAYWKAVEVWRERDMAVRRARGEHLAELVAEAELSVKWRSRQRPGPRGRLLQRGVRGPARRQAA